MRSAENIKRLIKDARIEINPEVKKAALAELINELKKSKITNPAGTKPNIGRIIMKSRITKLAVAAVIIIAVILGLNIIGGVNKSGQVFASTIQKIRNARTVTFTMEAQVGQKTLRSENSYKEPGLQRAEVPGRSVMIIDLIQKKTIFINHLEKDYSERYHEDVPADLTQDFLGRLKALPDRANEVLAKKEMDGRIVQGFCVIEDGWNVTFWIDIQTGDPIRVEWQNPNAPNTRIVSTNFNFDVDLDDALFSLMPPDGYTQKELPKIDRSEVNCQDLINLLRWWATNTEDHSFPPSLELAEFRNIGMEMKKAGKISGIQGTKDEKMQHMMKMTRGLRFVLMMRPENDWHYVGKGVELGDAETAICWFRPQGSKSYRVIYGDLSFVKDIATEDLPE